MYKQILIILIISLSLISVCAADEVLKLRFANHTVCIDDSINQHHGTYNNISFGTGIRNGCASFTYNTSKISFDNPTHLSFTDDVIDKPFSVSFWVKHYNIVTDEPVISKGINPGSYEYCITTTGTEAKGTFILFDTFSGYNLQCQTEKFLYEYSLYDGWIHGFLTYDGSSNVLGMNIYLNGILVDCDRAGHPSYQCMTHYNSPVNIGYSNYSGTPTELYGDLDEVIIYDYCVDVTEVQHIYNQYLLSGYTITLLDKDLISTNKNISVYKNSEYIETVQYGDAINVSNVYEYSFVVHEDNFDRFSDIRNIENTTSNGISYISYTFMIVAVLSLLIYMYRRF